MPPRAARAASTDATRERGGQLGRTPNLTTWTGSDTPRRKPGACASKPASDQPEPCTGLRYQRMYRNPCVAPQRVALRATVKQADGVRASAVAIGNRWLSLARGTLPAQAENSRKGHDPWSLLLTQRCGHSIRATRHGRVGC